MAGAHPGEWHGAVLIVSHDRYFLDNTVNTIWEMNAARHRSLSRQLQRLPAAAPGALGILRAGVQRRKSPPAQRGGFHPAQLGARQHPCPRPGPAAPPEPRPGGGRNLRHHGAAQRQEVGMRWICGRAPAGCDRRHPQGECHPDWPATARRACARAWPSAHD